MGPLHHTPVLAGRFCKPNREKTLRRKSRCSPIAPRQAKRTLAQTSMGSQCCGLTRQNNAVRHIRTHVFISWNSSQCYWRLYVSTPHPTYHFECGVLRKCE